MTIYAITFLLTTPASERQVERLAAELAEDARAHLRPGEELALASVEPAPAERPPPGAWRAARAEGGSGQERGGEAGAA